MAGDAVGEEIEFDWGYVPRVIVRSPWRDGSYLRSSGLLSSLQAKRGRGRSIELYLRAARLMLGGRKGNFRELARSRGWLRFGVSLGRPSGDQLQTGRGRMRIRKPTFPGWWAASSTESGVPWTTWIRSPDEAPSQVHFGTYCRILRQSFVSSTRVRSFFRARTSRVRSTS
jgi:hypothetical protein